MDVTAAVQRERRTEQRIRQLDATDIVQEIHALEDRVEALEEGAGRLREAGREVIHQWDCGRDKEELLAALAALEDALKDGE